MGEASTIAHGGRMGEDNTRVKRVIQHKRTRLYLTTEGGWTAELEEADQLPNVLAAVRRSRELELQEVELVLKFENGKYDVRLDL
ncbi:MAG TPA: hypothetical protein VKM56_09770 [Verrucomicrobiae bacterium]|nr:hypothetical protein [Verrucomicrobiae bacterium]